MLNEIYTKYINKDFSKPIRNENLNVVGYGIYNNSHTEEANRRNTFITLFLFMPLIIVHQNK